MFVGVFFGFELVSVCGFGCISWLCGDVSLSFCVCDISVCVFVLFFVPCAYFLRMRLCMGELLDSTVDTCDSNIR